MKHILLYITSIIAAFAVSQHTYAVPSVSLLTCHAGADIYQLEGHTGLRLKDPDRNIDIVINWGLFDFAAPNFVYRFVKGETDYMCGATDTSIFLGIYRNEGRTVMEQQLNLDSAQVASLIDMVHSNLEPANRVYRYNYVLDNCATRPLAIIEKAIGDTLRLGPPSLEAQNRTTFRNVMRHYHINYPWYQFGIDLALGSGIDRPISSRELSFAPEQLETMMRGARLPDGAPAVLSNTVLWGTYGHDATLPATSFWLTPVFWAILLLVVSIVISVIQLKQRGSTPPVSAKIFDTFYFSLAGITGCVLTFLIFVSVHEATSPNWLYLWLNPLCLAGAVLPWLKRAKILEFWYQSVNFALLIALAVIFISGVQSPNPAFILLMAADAIRAVTNAICAKR